MKKFFLIVSIISFITGMVLLFMPTEIWISIKHIINTIENIIMIIISLAILGIFIAIIGFFISLFKGPSPKTPRPPKRRFDNDNIDIISETISSLF